jgi:carbamoyl-phosphate synthase small subunit
VIHESRPIFSTQFHPEAKGGPLDSSYLFDMYLENVQKYKQGQSAFQPQRDSKPSPLLVDLLAKERVGVDLTQGTRNMMAASSSSNTNPNSQEPERVYAAGAA